MKIPYARLRKGGNAVDGFRLRLSGSRREPSRALHDRHASLDRLYGARRKRLYHPA
jgi:hypothetical protein